MTAPQLETLRQRVQACTTDPSFHRAHFLFSSKRVAG
jgi:hypothetical protein